MDKGKVKNGNGTGDDSLAPPQSPLLRSRKRKCSSDEISETDDVKDILNKQDMENKNTAVDAALPECQQESTSVVNHRAEHSSLIEQNTSAEEKTAENSSNDVCDNAVEADHKAPITNINTDSHLKGFVVCEDNNAKKTVKDNEEIMTDQFQIFLPNSEEADGPCATALDEHLDERVDDTSRRECSNLSMADVLQMTKDQELIAGKKKRRMAMCSVSWKERSHFLNRKKSENEQSRKEEADQKCNSTDDMAQEEITVSPLISLSIPAGGVKEQNDAEVQPQSSHCGGNDREQIPEDEEVILPGSEQSGETNPGEPADKNLVGNQEQQELECHAANGMTQIPQQQVKDTGDGSLVEVDQCPTMSALLVNAMPRDGNEKKEALICDADDKASSTNLQSAEFSCGPADVCDVTVSSGGSERTHSVFDPYCVCKRGELLRECDPDDEPGASPTLNTSQQHQQTRDMTDPFGSGCLDYVSDSQLNTIALTEQELMKREEDRHSPGCSDATDLICGLIKELSSLNRTVMATHRELENLRRSSRSSRSSTR